MKRSAYIACLFIFFFLSGSLLANIRLPAVIGSHMVLQQRSQVTIWGWCDVSEQIKLKTGWDTTTYTATGSTSAKWEIKINAPGAGGPYQVRIDGNNKIILDDVLIGEVWICSGQSNMEMSMDWGLPYKDEPANATDKSIRFFNIPRTTADYPQDDVRAEWVVCNPDDMKKFSAVAFGMGHSQICSAKKGCRLIRFVPITGMYRSFSIKNERQWKSLTCNWNDARHIR